MQPAGVSTLVPGLLARQDLTRFPNPLSAQGLFVSFHPFGGHVLLPGPH